MRRITLDLYDGTTDIAVSDDVDIEVFPGMRTYGEGPCLEVVLKGQTEDIAYPGVRWLKVYPPEKPK